VIGDDNANPAFIAADALKSGKLKVVLQAHSPEPLGLYAIRPSRKFTPLRIKRLIESHPLPFYQIYMAV